MKTFIALLLLTCLFHVPQAWAQCAPGIPEAGNPECLPPDDANSPYYQGDRNQQPAQPRQPQAVWADRWGAIARDEASGDAGTIEGQDSKSKANQIAMSICQRNGSRNCKILLSFYNQCAAVALSAKIIDTAGGPTSQSAEETALSGCSSQSKQCKIVYSKCSYAERIR